MKAMKLVMMAVVAVFMGTTLLTSCLNSDGDSRRIDGRIVNVNTFGGISFENLRTDDGLILHPSNPTVLQYDDNGVKTYVDRAYITYYIEEDQIIDENTKELNIEIYSGARHFIRNIEYEKIEGKTSPLGIDIYRPAATSRYLDFIVRVPFTSNDKFSLDNYKVYLDKAENETIYINLVNLEEADNYTSQYIDLSFYLNTPSKTRVLSLNPEFTFLQNDSAYVQITAKAPADKSSEDKKATVLKVKINQ